MKKNLLTTMAVMLIASTGLVFTSCEDLEEAEILSGEWTGDMGMYYSDGRYEYDADYTDIRFVQDYELATRGWGEEIDYFDRPCPIRYQSFRFEWRVSNGVIYLTYPYAHNLDVQIRDYKLSSRRFRGWIGDTKFTLVKLVDYSDWDLYDSNGYGYGYWNGYYAATRAGVDSIPVTTDNVSPENFTFGRRFNEVNK